MIIQAGQDMRDHPVQLPPGLWWSKGPTCRVATQQDAHNLRQKRLYSLVGRLITAQMCWGHAGAALHG